MLGAQEVRRHFTGIFSEEGYTVARAACNKDGSAGVLIAVSSILEFAHPIENCKLPRTVSADDVSIVMDRRNPNSLDQKRAYLAPDRRSITRTVAPYSMRTSI